MSKEGVTPQAATPAAKPTLHTVNGAFTLKGEDYAKLVTLAQTLIESIRQDATIAGAQIANMRVDFAHHGDHTSRLNP